MRRNQPILFLLFLLFSLKEPEREISKTLPMASKTIAVMIKKYVTINYDSFVAQALCYR